MTTDQLEDLFDTLRKANDDGCIDVHETKRLIKIEVIKTREVNPVYPASERYKELLNKALENNLNRIL